MLIPVPTTTADDNNNNNNDKKGGVRNDKRRELYYLKSYKFNRYLTSDVETGKVYTVKISSDNDSENNVDNDDNLAVDTAEDVNSNNKKKVDDWIAAAKLKAENAFADDTPSKSKLGDAEQWLLMRSPHHQHNSAATTNSGGYFIVSAKHEMNITNQTNLINDGEGRRVTSNTVCLKGDNSIEASWILEFVSGELCFMSSPPAAAIMDVGGGGGGGLTDNNNNNKQIRCDLMGNLSLTNDKRGWEVWRFVELGNGKVRIVSWMHSQFCIACYHVDGRVSTVAVGKGDGGDMWCDEWTVEKAPDGHDGVVIKSVACARRILCRQQREGSEGAIGGGGGGGLSTVQEFEGESCVWQLDAAHSQVYTLTSLYHKRSIGPFPYVTENMKQSDQLILQLIDNDGTVRLYHKGNGLYLRSGVEGEVDCGEIDNEHRDDNTDEPSLDLWKMEQSRDGGGYTFTSKIHGGLLSFSDDEVNPKLCTVSTISDANREMWCINPLLPRAISSGKIKTFAIGTSVAVGTTVAMPFLMAGMLAVVPAEATLAASVMAAGLTGAEAIASVGAIGVTAAIVFREDNDTIGIESEHQDDGEDGKNYTKRPLCAWRSW
jgi:hypothetical protein